MGANVIDSALEGQGEGSINLVEDFGNDDREASNLLGGVIEASGRGAGGEKAALSGRKGGDFHCGRGVQEQGGGGLGRMLLEAFLVVVVDDSSAKDGVVGGVWDDVDQRTRGLEY